MKQNRKPTQREAAIGRIFADVALNGCAGQVAVRAYVETPGVSRATFNKASAAGLREFKAREAAGMAPDDMRLAPGGAS